MLVDIMYTGTYFILYPVLYPRKGSPCPLKTVGLCVCNGRPTLHDLKIL